MSRLTQAERRRVWLAQQEASQRMLDRLATPTGEVVEAARAEGRLLKAVVKAALVVSLLGGGYIAAHLLEFHPPASIVEALLPRL